MKTDLTLNYENLDASALKPVISMFGRSKLPVLKDADGNPKAEANNRQRRIQGQPTKQATLYFTDGQALTLMVSPDGVVYQWKLNNKPLPVRDIHDLAKAVKEVAAKVKSNSDAFTAKLAKQVDKAHRDDVGGGAKKAVNRSIPARLKATKLQIEEAEAKLKDVQTEVSQSQSNMQQVQSSVEDATKELHGLNERNHQLTEEYEALKAA